MKKILFCLSIALAIFLPKSFYTQDAKPTPGFKIAQHESAFLDSQCNNENLFSDDYLEDFSDDNLSDSERKNLLLGKPTSCNTSFVAQNFSGNYFKRNLSAKSFLDLQASLFIFIRVIRL